MSPAHAHTELPTPENMYKANRSRVTQVLMCLQTVREKRPSGRGSRDHLLIRTNTTVTYSYSRQQPTATIVDIAPLRTSQRLPSSSRLLHRHMHDLVMMSDLLTMSCDINRRDQRRVYTVVPPTVLSSRSFGPRPSWKGPHVHVESTWGANEGGFTTTEVTHGG